MTVEAAVRAMTRTERIAYLRTNGWQRISYHGAQSWLSHAPADHAHYTLAAAIRAALAIDKEIARD